MANAMKIVSVDDVGNDQGKQVRVSWSRNSFDSRRSDTTVVEYSVWRRIDPLPSEVAMIASRENDRYEDSASMNEQQRESNPELRLLTQVLPIQEWDFILTVPAIRAQTYNVVAPTLADSTITNGMHWSVFRVVAHTDDPSLFFLSRPDSGYSIDNLVPHAPSGLIASAGDDEIVLTWSKVPDEDFDYYTVYRSTESGFDPGLLEPYFVTVDTSFTDFNVDLDTQYFYRIAAIDFSGNEGEFSEEVSAVIIGVDGERVGFPDKYTLAQNYPNPFNPETKIRFAFPEAEFTRIIIYDQLGREVTRLVYGHLGAGYHEVTWNASNYASGIYFYRLQAGEFVQTRKMVLLK